jgi:hypothetical protein
MSQTIMTSQGLVTLPIPGQQRGWQTSGDFAGRAPASYLSTFRLFGDPTMSFWVTCRPARRLRHPPHRVARPRSAGRAQWSSPGRDLPAAQRKTMVDSAMPMPWCFSGSAPAWPGWVCSAATSFVQAAGVGAHGPHRRLLPRLARFYLDRSCSISPKHSRRHPTRPAGLSSMPCGTERATGVASGGLRWRGERILSVWQWFARSSRRAFERDR